MRETSASRQGLIDLVNTLECNDLNMIEVGSFAGESAEIFLSTGKVKHIICIDPWTTIENGEGNSYSGMEAIEKQFDQRLEKYGNNVTKFKGTIDTFINSNLFNEFKPDFVYIDALHTYDACKHDILNVIEKLNPRLAIGGHDYADQPEYIRGVKKAVNEIFVQPDMTFADTSWLVHKKPNGYIISI